MTAYPKKERGIARAWLLGLVLILLNCFWIVQMEELRYAAGATLFSLFFNAVFTLWMLFLLNGILRRFFPENALETRELAAIYIMVNMVTALCNYDMLPMLPPIMSYAFWGATPENEWRELFHRDLPQWLIVDESPVLTGYYRGESTFYTTRNLAAWLPPLLWWSLFTMVVFFVMLCINTVVRKQWVETEKLAYPIAEIPLTLVQAASYNRLLWIGFAIACGINVINGLHFLYPSVPELAIFKRQHIGSLFTDKPWTGLRAMRISFIPSMIGLSFFVPLDLLFSCWFFYFYWQGMRILGVMLSWQTYPAYGHHAYIVQESVGAYLAALTIAIWRGRRHFLKTIKSLLGGNDSTADETNVPMSYRKAWIGIVCGIGLLVLFCHKAGMSAMLAILFFVFYYAISTAITRLRAETGFPEHDVHFGGPAQTISSTLGTANLSKRTQVMFPLLWFISRSYEGHLMPHQLEGFKIADRTGLHRKHITWSMLLACGFGVIVIFWSLLHVGYRVGGENIFIFRRWGREPWSYLQEWIRNPTEVDYNHMSLMGLGAIVASFLALLRARFVWWPLHPMGYAVAGSYGMSFLWSCMLVSWLLKWLILRHGGMRRYRQAVPLFLGLILGEFTVTAVWAIIGISLNWPRLYQFWI